MIGIEVWLYHWAGGFRRHAMWAPVLLTPLVVLAALLGALAIGGLVWNA